MKVKINAFTLMRYNFFSNIYYKNIIFRVDISHYYITFLFFAYTVISFTLL